MQALPQRLQFVHKKLKHLSRLFLTAGLQSKKMERLDRFFSRGNLKSELFPSL